MYFVFRYIGNKDVNPIPMYVKTLIRDRYIGMGYVRGVPMYLGMTNIGISVLCRFSMHLILYFHPTITLLYFPPTITLLYQEHIHIVYIQIFLI